MGDRRLPRAEDRLAPDRHLVTIRTPSEADKHATQDSGRAARRTLSTARRVTGTASSVFGFNIDPGDYGFFRKGLNVIEVRATKRPSTGPPSSTSIGVRNCNNGQPGHQFGLWFTISGHFAADLALGDVAASAGTSQALTFYSKSRKVITVFTVRNDGLSLVLKGAAAFTITGAQSVLNAALSPGFAGDFPGGLTVPATPPFTSCTITKRTSRFDITCPFERFEPRTAAKIQLLLDFGAESQPPAGDLRMGDIQWSVSGRTADPDPKNNTRVAILDRCGSSSTSPGC